MSPFEPGALRSDWKARSFPSGDHRAFEELKAALVRRVAGEDPSDGLIHSSVWRRFSASMMLIRVKTTKRPSGEIAGVAALSMR